MFANLKWYDSALIVILMISAFGVPFAWQFVTIGLTAALALTVVKNIITRQWVNTVLQRRHRIACYLMMSYYVVHLISITYSADVAYAWTYTNAKLIMLLAPLVLLLNDTSFVQRRHIKAIMQCLILSLGIIFCYRFGIALSRIANDATYGEIYNKNFHPMHHSYMALYCTVAMGFAFTELWTALWNGQPERHRWLKIALMSAFIVAMIVFVVLIDSRAGELYIVLFAGIVIAQLAICQRQWIATLIIIAVGIGALTYIYPKLPDRAKRLQNTTLTNNGEEKQDARVIIWKSGLQAAQESLIYGHGAGDFRTAINKYMAKNGYDYGAEHSQESHNQIINSLVATGLIGTLLLLAMYIAPLWLIRRHDRYGMTVAILTVLAIFMQSMFESLMGRQMGLTFIVLTYIIIILLPTTYKAANTNNQPLQNGI